MSLPNKNQINLGLLGGCTVRLGRGGERGAHSEAAWCVCVGG